jgi:hypothetical protein
MSSSPVKKGSDSFCGILVREGDKYMLCCFPYHIFMVNGLYGLLFV